MAIFGQLPLERFDALLLRGDQPLERFDALLLMAQGDHGLFESFAQVLIRLLRLLQFIVFVMSCCAQGRILSSQLFEFFFQSHTATLAN